MYECRMQTGKYLTIIGRAFNRHHATILYGIRAHADRLISTRERLEATL